MRKPDRDGEAVDVGGWFDVNHARAVESSLVKQLVEVLVGEAETAVGCLAEELVLVWRKVNDDHSPTRGEESTGLDDTVEEIFTELREGQTRLANEQARYQIAFRQDLANLVEQLRRS